MSGVCLGVSFLLDMSEIWYTGVVHICLHKDTPAIKMVTFFREITFMSLELLRSADPLAGAKLAWLLALSAATVVHKITMWVVTTSPIFQPDVTAA